MDFDVDNDRIDLPGTPSSFSKYYWRQKGNWTYFGVWKTGKDFVKIKGKINAPDISLMSTTSDSSIVNTYDAEMKQVFMPENSLI